MNVDPQIQVQILDIQAKDTETAQLEYKRATLPAIEVKKALESSFERARDQQKSAPQKKDSPKQVGCHGQQDDARSSNTNADTNKIRSASAEALTKRHPKHC